MIVHLSLRAKAYPQDYQGVTFFGVVVCIWCVRVRVRGSALHFLYLFQNEDEWKKYFLSGILLENCIQRKTKPYQPTFCPELDQRSVPDKK